MRRRKDGKPLPQSLRRPLRMVKPESHPVAAGERAVRSEIERSCVALLEKHQIRFQYEPLLLLQGRQYRPDFYLPEYRLFVEMCGYGHMPHYRSRLSWKKKLYEEAGLKAVFIEASSTTAARRKLSELLAELRANALTEDN